MSVIHSRQPKLTYSASRPFTKNKKIKETGDSRYIYQNELDKTCFQLDMVYEDFKDLNRRTAADDKILRDKVFDIAENQKYDKYQRQLILLVYNFFDIKSSGGAIKWSYI